MASEPLTIGFNVHFDEAIAEANAKEIVLPDIFYNELKGIERQKAFSIAGVTSIDQLQQVKDSLDKAMKEGLSFGEWKALTAVMSLSLPDYRLDNIFRTQLQGSYMVGKWIQFMENKENRPYLIFDAINDARVRPNHLAYDGVIRPIDDQLWATASPPLGFRCRCSLVSVGESQAKSRSGQGSGLNKIPMVKGADGMFYPAQPDKGWDYNPYMEMQKIEVTPDHIVPRTPETRVDYDALAKKEFNRRLARWAKFLNADESAMRETMRANAQGVADRSEVYLRANRESLGRMLKSGAADSHTGEIATKEWQGWADLYQEKFVDYALNAKSNPPIIGYLSESDDLAMGNYSLDKSGDIAIKLKSSVKVRTTAMYSDTTAVISDSSPVVIPRPLDDMDEGTIHLYAYGKSQRPDSIADTSNQVNFWQAHVFDGVKTSDIDTILFSVEPPKVLQNQLKKAGIDWRIGNRIETELDDIIEF
jgi:SPP1 gp7 family putative phage head morphogenesis protein